MKIIAIILFTVTVIALIVFVSSLAHTLRWRQVKEMRQKSRGALIGSTMVMFVSVIGGIWLFNLNTTILTNTKPAIQKKAPALPEALKSAASASSASSKPNNQAKGTMVNTFSNAQQYPYQELIASDKLASKAFGLNQAKVTQVGDSKGHTFVLAFDTSAPKDVYIMIFNGKETIHTGNTLNVTGILGKRTTYQTADKQNKTVPTINVVQSVISGS
ncbi:hypothetical protein KAR50_05455 [Periweissella fabaria]|uniref:Uncharacterized protein n=1 Tax=Periweissella fabaria TaxID=546157 RepID=A0ABM8Z494_9LACO|nr:hypothetical protein [Periweissella fabaria]MCM0597287.1 hypothetical protein [Periweissella fabaria]CAH0416207.1 hypothetical protein WFA24289_00506 [Periweissella fabaria]